MLKKLIAVCALTAVSVCQSLHAETDSNTTMLTNTCVACHGNEGNSNGPAIPNIAGLSPIYFIGAMLAYKYEDEDQLLEIIDGDVDFEDVEAFPRYSTIMGRIAKGYTEEEIKLMAEYFSAKEVVRPAQAFNVTMAAEGKKTSREVLRKMSRE